MWSYAIGLTLLYAVIFGFGAATSAPDGSHKVRHHRNGLPSHKPASPEDTSGYEHSESFLDSRPPDKPYVVGKVAGNDAYFGDIVTGKCLKTSCSGGKQCRLNSRSQPYCACVDENACEEGRAKVCGSDGVVYDSHCHLHRAACVEKRHIRVDENWDQCQSDSNDSEESVEEEVEEEDEESDKQEESVESDEIIDKESSSKKKDLGHSEVPQVLEPASVYSEVAVRCDRMSFRDFKKRMLEYHCNRIGLRQCYNVIQDEGQTRFLVDAMFAYYDKNYDDKLNAEELAYGQGTDHIEKIASTCRLTDLLVFQEDADAAGATEMSKAAFGAAYGIDGQAEATKNSLVTPAPEVAPNPRSSVRLSPSSVIVNEAVGIQLQCMASSVGNQIVWERNGVDLAEAKVPSIQVLTDGSLNISPINLHHTGNYTCYDRQAPLTVEVHSITAQLAPVVRTQQMSRKSAEGEMVELQCRYEGIPCPQSVRWEVNGYGLPGEDAERYSWLNSNTTLRIKAASASRDTGVYACVARTDAGRGQDVIDLKISEDASLSSENTGAINRAGKFLIFHEDGYTLYEPQICVVTHSVDRYAPDFKAFPPGFETLGILCPPEKPCRWGSAVPVKNTFVYVSQPDENRIVLIDILHNARPLQVIATDREPGDLFYVKHLDQVWVLCGKEGAKTIIVIREASKDVMHKAVHMQASGAEFDKIEMLFIPPADNDYDYTFLYAYATHVGQQGMTKIDLASLTYTEFVNLSRYDCHPKRVEFLVIGGLSVIQCSSPSDERANQGLLLLLDTVTGAIVSSSFGQGTVTVTPNGRQIIVAKGADHIIVHSVADDGRISIAHEDWLSINVAEVLFMPAKASYGYDMIVYSSDEDTVFFMDMQTRKMEMLEGIATGRKEAFETPHRKQLVTASGDFGVYLALPSKGVILVINKHWHNIQCQWSNLKNPNIALWLSA